MSPPVCVVLFIWNGDSLKDEINELLHPILPRPSLYVYSFICLLYIYVVYMYVYMYIMYVLYLYVCMYGWMDRIQRISLRGY